MLCCTIPYYTVPYHAIPYTYHTIPCDKAPYETIIRYTIPHQTLSLKPFLFQPKELIPSYPPYPAAPLIRSRSLRATLSTRLPASLSWLKWTLNGRRLTSKASFETPKRFGSCLWGPWTLPRRYPSCTSEKTKTCLFETRSRALVGVAISGCSQGLQ